MFKVDGSHEQVKHFYVLYVVMIGDFMRNLFYSLLLIITLIGTTYTDELFEAKLHNLVLQSSLMEHHPSSENSKEYEVVFDKIYKEILPKFEFEPDDQLMGFYEFISKYEISKMKYFVPLLEKIKSSLKMKLMDGEEGVVKDHFDVLGEVLEIINSKLEDYSNTETTDSEDEITANTKVPVEDPTVTEENDSDLEDIDSNDPTSDQDIADLKTEMGSLKESITDSVSKIGELQSEIKGLQNNDEDIELIQEKLEQVAKDKEKVLEELKSLKEKMEEYEKSKAEILNEIAALKEKLDGAPEMPKPPKPPEGPKPAPAPKPAPKPEKPVYKRPPFFCDFRIYGSKAAAVRSIKSSISSAKANQPGFDPRIHNLVQGNWANLLKKYNYKGLPTELIGEMGAAGIRVQLGADSKALELSKQNYLAEVKKYLKSGGQKCLVQLAKTAGLDYKTKKLSCK